MKARHIALYFTEGIKNKKESLTATVVVCVYIESTENTPNMAIKIFFFWNSFVKWWHQKFNQIFDLNECIILYGWHKNTPYNSLLNYAQSSCSKIPHFRYQHMQGLLGL